MKKRISVFLAALLVSVVFVSAGAEAATLTYDEDDAALLAGLISAEARGEDYEGQLAVGNVVLNRVKDGYWGDTLEEVIFYEGQFTRPRDTYTDISYDAAVAALEGEEAVPEYIMYFQKKKTDYFYGPYYCTIGRHKFYGAPQA